MGDICCSGREYKNLIMDCCQLEDHLPQRGVKREEASGNDPENGSPDADKGGKLKIARKNFVLILTFFNYINVITKKLLF